MCGRACTPYDGTSCTNEKKLRIEALELAAPAACAHTTLIREPRMHARTARLSAHWTFRTRWQIHTLRWHWRQPVSAAASLTLVRMVSGTCFITSVRRVSLAPVIALVIIIVEVSAVVVAVAVVIAVRLTAT